MKTFIFVTALLFIAATSDLFAQPANTDTLSVEKRIDKQVEKIKTDLKLSDQQALKVRELMIRQNEENKVLREKAEALKKETKKNRDAFDSSLKNVLTPEQYQLYTNKRNKKREEAENNKMRQSLIIMKDELKLSDEQTDKITALMVSLNNDVSSARNTYASDETKMKEEIRKLHKEYQKQLKNILSPEQFRKLREMKKKKMIRF